MDALNHILKLLAEKRGFDFSGYRRPMLERRLQKRMFITNCGKPVEYLEYLQDNTEELDALIDVFTINVSSFFRNPLVFEYLERIVLHKVINPITLKKDGLLRIWSAGCSRGEEPYSIAMAVSEFLKKEKKSLDTIIFATDIDKKALSKGKSGIYDKQSLFNIKLGMAESYLKEESGRYLVDDELKKTVKFSFFNLLDNNHIFPPESIYGSFDMVFCRNVLIYFERESQGVIFEKLYKSLKTNGFLVLGEAELPPSGQKGKFRRESKCCKIYKKIG
ncbi:MAG: protein-glutamate O-methyltransferase CheR [Chlorobi bacterium]|nr:protein-glutamate O-methyltransferase CheR [Chlorobiota bacterium]